MAPCTFCEIIRGERDAYILWKNEQTTAFLDRNPAIHGHTLVVPNNHQESLFTRDESVSAAVFETVHIVATAMDRTLKPDGVSTFYTSGSLVGNVDHAHVHLLPRYADDEIGLALARAPLDDDDAARFTANIQENL